MRFQSCLDVFVSASAAVVTVVVEAVAVEETSLAQRKPRLE